MPSARLEEGIDPVVLEQLRQVPIRPGRPLLVVDADEVLVVFSAHLARFAAAQGVEMRLKRYELEGTFFLTGTERALDFQESIGLINRFFAEECGRMEAIPGAREALGRLAEIAQIVVLTNVPRQARAARVENLAELGMGYPLVENGGGKGKALAWLAAKAGAGAGPDGVPGAFIDDSPRQIESAAKRAPVLRRLHFVGAPLVARVIPDCAAADQRVRNWDEAERHLRAHLDR
ncbi:MAG: hypothetical protein ACFBSD_08870 [Paracoccaceae bacterium]